MIRAGEVVTEKELAAFKNHAEEEVENRASVCAGCNPHRGNRTAAGFCGKS